MKFQSLLIAAAVTAALASSSAQAVQDLDPTAELRARAVIASNAGKLFVAADDEFTLRNVSVDADGTEHARFNRSYKGMPVIGGDFVVHSRFGKFRNVSQTMTSKSRPSLVDLVGADEAILNAGVAFGPGFKGLPTASRVIYARDVTPTLAYEVVMKGQKADQTPTEMHYFVDAKSGAILDAWDMVHTAKPGSGGGGGGTGAVGTGRTLMYGNVTLNTASASGSFNLTDTTRGGGATYDANNATYSTAARRAVLFTDADNTWGNNSQSDRATVAADAHYGVATTWDFYKNTFGRNGIFNDGKGVKSYVHVGNGWVNAAWYANAMYYGDGGGSYLPLVSLDIAGHEMSHGVNQATAGLVYSGDAGGLNEANSDIMGTLVEFYANSASDPGDYKIGEEIYVNGTSALRYMYDPNLDGNYSYDCYPAATFSGVDPHYSSGPANHFFYLLAEGTGSLSKTCAAGDTKNATGNGTLAGIGRAKAGAIWYRALDLYFTSGTSYPGARTATLQAASDLYGSASAERAAVAAAWTAINVN